MRTQLTDYGFFYDKWVIDILGPFLEVQGKVKFLIVAIDYFTKWIEAKPVVTITRNQVKKFIWDNIVCRFGLPGEIIADNGKHFKDNPFKDWCDKLNIKQRFASVKHPQTNGQAKGKQEKDKIGTKLDKNGKRGKARQCRRPITVEKEEKEKKYKFKGPNMKILQVVFNQ
uniref:Reverse transcriptase domain-containing protein n=1 Tax=Tanacetum cinerariifolium TaxID=118510 RepID=A0A699ISW2_TANCI|nr:reverse transcriptase domain-containing protein [Tanacetum cinerariifolium]